MKPQGRFSPDEEGATRAVHVPDPTKPWFRLREDDREEGPIPVSALRSLIRSGQVGADTYLWQEGMEEWTHASELPQLVLLWEERELALPPVPDSPLLPLAPLSEGVAPLEPAPAAPLQPAPQLRGTLAEFLFDDLSHPRELVTDIIFPPTLQPAPRNKAVRREQPVVVATRPGQEVEEPTSIGWLPEWTGTIAWALWIVGAIGACIGMMLLVSRLR